ncbi:SUN domain-containing protein 1 isoform X7 [Cygnus atratus]|uniref:SUN domain-containing protein 1 isoform X7 n=1 Tax=Cygnus atratus TaxID=8868 RepID=UPI0021B6FC97|nr:SUN domain-containing protein 1 isoform X7 [Cygnus atratus]XP_050569811.1 SUN domain-containing protein 1 isoform X7 [Cygnus atratus]XP_050569812.1 SUN domain-containing protein 1 isoform X7 [Cygnus atratus]XP_050569813.1 SUN domain-containing protein 1 isoform X7 [Cygnus atratus]XP_050569814.1 SUN domain-containing protein 1 isoform X7 [Cygnus atratus]
MDFSRLHMYTPPQCVPENTGYTYALSSSYSSDALDFEIEHKIDPVFDSPRMSRRSLRLAAAGFNKTDGARSDTLRDSSYSGNMTFREQSKVVRQRKSTNKQSGSVRETPRKTLFSSPIYSQSSFNSHTTDASMVSTVLDESSIREQTEVDHFWGLDDDGEPKGSDTMLTQGNGDIATAEAQTTMINGYTCSDCSMLSERKEALTARSASCMPSSRIYSRDRSQRHASRGTYFFMSKILRLVKHTATSFASLLVQLFQMVLLKLSYEFKGRAASGMFRLLRTGWYQLVTLLSLLKVFLLRRCLPKIFKLLLFVIPLLFLLGIWFWGFDGFVSLLPVLNWTRIDKVQRIDDSNYVPEPQPDSSHTVQPTKGTINIFDSGRISELEKQMALVSDRCHHHDEEYSKVMLLLHNLQDQVAQMGDRSEILKLIKNVMDQHLKEIKLEEKTDFLALHQEHELRIVMLEDLLKKLSAESEDIQKELDVAKAKTVREDEHNQLLSRVKKLELELSQVKSELLTGESVKTSCEKIDVIHEKVDAQVKESVKMMFFGDQHEDFSESLLQWLTSNFVTKSDLQTLLRDLELQILKNITQHMSVTNQRITSEVVTNVVNNAGISGITEAQAQIIVNNALKLYSQDKTGMVDFALESGGGSILSTRCSETYETKTALISLFGIPLWYFSQSPRVVIQPDMYPGNCWAFKGSEGYLVVRLSMKIYPTAFTMEHIPKTLSPSGNITSAPRNFSVYGLDDEYQEEGVLLGQYIYDQEGEPLQMFPVMEKSNNVFQIVELRILSNWGHAEYTCLYRFRVHGKPAE